MPRSAATAPRGRRRAASPPVRASAPHPLPLRSPRSRSTTAAALRPGIPVTPPPGMGAGAAQVEARNRRRVAGQRRRRAHSEELVERHLDVVGTCVRVAVARTQSLRTGDLPLDRLERSARAPARRRSTCSRRRPRASARPTAPRPARQGTKVESQMTAWSGSRVQPGSRVEGKPIINGGSLRQLAERDSREGGLDVGIRVRRQHQRPLETGRDGRARAASRAPRRP